MSETDGSANGADDGLAELMQSGSREDVAVELAPLVAGALARLLGSRERALDELPKVLKSLVATRRRFKGGSVRAWVLGALREKGLGSPEEMKRSPEMPDRLHDLLAPLGDEAIEAVELTAVENLNARDTAEVLGEPAAVVERRAALAFAKLAEEATSA